MGTVPGLYDLADRQLAVVSRTQLAGLGVSRHHVRRQVQAQRWQLVGSRVVALVSGVLAREQRWWVAALHCGTSGALASLTVLEIAGLAGWESPDAHVLVPHSVRVPALPGLVVHQSRAFGPDDIRQVGGFPCTSVARAAIDAAAAQRHPRRAAGLVVAVVQQRVTTPERLLDELDARPVTTHAPVLRAVLLEASSGADSVREIDVSRLLRRAGLASYRRQVPVTTPEGVGHYDLGADLADGTLLLVEVDGRHHLDPRRRIVDQAKDAAAIAQGHRVLRIPVDALPAAEAQVVEQFRTIRVEAERRTGRRNAS